MDAGREKESQRMQSGEFQARIGSIDRSLLRSDMGSRSGCEGTIIQRASAWKNKKLHCLEEKDQL